MSALEMHKEEPKYWLVRWDRTVMPFATLSPIIEYLGLNKNDVGYEKLKAVRRKEKKFRLTTKCGDVWVYMEEPKIQTTKYTKDLPVVERKAD